MSAAQPIAAALIVVALFGLALYFGRQQRQSLRWLRGQSELSAEDRRYYRRQAWLRLVNCGLMLVLAALVAAYYLSGMEARVTALGDRMQGGERFADLDAEHAHLAWLFAAFCCTILALLMTIVFLVAVDVWSIRRYGRRHLRQIQADRKAMVESQIARLRSERNGHN